MSSILQSEQHLDADQFSAFVDGALPAQERLASVAHLAGCSECRQVILLLQNEEVLPPSVPQTVPAWRRWLVLHPLLWAATAALASTFVTSTAFLWHNKSLVSSSKQIARTEVERFGMNATQSPSHSPLSGSIQSPDAMSQNPIGRPSQKAHPRIQSTNGQTYDSQIADAAAALHVDNDEADTFDIEGGDVTQGTKQVKRHLRPLPSNLHATLVVGRTHLKLAVDTEGSLFLSHDGGGHWHHVKSQWEGRILRLAVSSSLPSLPEQLPSPQPSVGSPDIPKSNGRFELNTDTGDVWISRDGLHWRR